MANSFGVSVCITAYQATRFIKECLDSIEQQTWFRERDNYEILVGVDNDPKTMRYLRKIMPNYKHIRVFMMNSNEGTYVTINTLFYLTKYDFVVRFDADDIMHANCIEEAMNKRNQYDFVRFKFRNFYETDFRWNHEVLIAHGIGLFRKSIIRHYGYFRPWRIAADTELLQRLKNFIRTGPTDSVVFARRVYEGSLTTAKSTSRNSMLRNYYSSIIKSARYLTAVQAIIPTVTNQYIEVFPLPGTK